MVLQPAASEAGPTEDVERFVPVAGVVSVAVIEDTLELVPTESGPAKTNKWHEKFAKSRTATK